MKQRRGAVISERKVPQQERSNELVAAVLKAAIHVLAKEGAARFTTARVAAKAGVSVGSVYQYFPNKAAILFRLQTDEWQQTSDMLAAISEEKDKPPLERLRALTHAFLRSECEEAAVRVALKDAAPLYRDAPEAKAARDKGAKRMRAFLREAAPGAPAIAADIVGTTLSAVGKQFSERPDGLAKVEPFADAVADMLCAYVESLGGGR